ncbi:MAG: hypothetical protein P4L33_10490 [Capsulimonadaceae bacterium]|nr:hypothetical protein [Capsulimonadaceae bacterium]
MSHQILLNGGQSFDDLHLSEELKDRIDKAMSGDKSSETVRVPTPRGYILIKPSAIVAFISTDAGEAEDAVKKAQRDEGSPARSRRGTAGGFA